ATDYDHGTAQRFGKRVAEQRYTGDRVGRFEMHQVVRDEEGIQRPFAHFVKIQIVLLFGIGVFGQAVDLGEGSAYDVIDNAAATPHFVELVQRSDFHHITAVLIAHR